jgi:dipeptide/tripeptide permease
MIIGSGSLRANLSIFGANQYKLPEQATQLSVYFTLQYFVLKSGSVIGRLVLPILRQDLKCFGMNDCYPLSFGVTSAVMFTGLVVLLCGYSCYVKKPPSGNMLIKVCKCILVWKISFLAFRLT